MPVESESTMTNDTTSGSTSMSTTSSEQFGSINLIVSKLGKKTLKAITVQSEQIISF